MSRVYDNVEFAIDELRRNVSELGTEVKLKTYQNVVVKDDPDFITKELVGESFKLTENVTSEDILNYIDKTRGNKWKSFCEVEFQERVGDKHINPGESYKYVGDYWTKFFNKTGKHDYNYNERIKPQLDLIIEELKRDLGTRRAVLSIWDNGQDPGNSLREMRVPCSLYYQFLIRNNKLHIIYTMRSSDVMQLLDIDIFMVLKLREYIADKLGIECGTASFFIGSLHAYTKDLGTGYF